MTKKTLEEVFGFLVVAAIFVTVVAIIYSNHGKSSAQEEQEVMWYRISDHEEVRNAFFYHPRLHDMGPLHFSQVAKSGVAVSSLWNDIRQGNSDELFQIWEDPDGDCFTADFDDLSMHDYIGLPDNVETLWDQLERNQQEYELDELPLAHVGEPGAGCAAFFSSIGAEQRASSSG